MSTEIFVGLYRLTTAHYVGGKVTLCYAKEEGQGPEVVLDKSAELTVTLGGEFSLVIQEVEGVSPPIIAAPGFPEFPLAPAPARPVTLPEVAPGRPVTLPEGAPGRPVTLPGGPEVPPQGPAVQPGPDATTLPGGPEPLPGGPAVQPGPSVEGSTKPNPKPEGPPGSTKPGVPLEK